MSPLTFGGQPIPGTRANASAAAPPARNAITRHSDRQAALADLPAGAEDVLLFVRMLALTVEARYRLRLAVAELREIDVDALNDPALADHPRRPAMLRAYEDAREGERLATIAVAEIQANLAAQWDRLSAEDINRYGLTTLIGESDPDARIDVTLWRDDTPLNVLAPLPDDWCIPADIAHIAYDPERTRFGVRTIDRAALLDAAPPF